ncbi:LPS export ABC transporter permease LptF [Candidatus Endoriftia persephonae]|uniref:Lipopolysaccharide export system permease protein LptF n=2 Tax=Gammaproteobacteria TaxID=1236 RepID=G2FC02_9GAMM|nr:LPS export ABC transporter permease LptF [Candidatus Endoriftia persephone]EGW55833.1 permease YjgP/YjgQ family protein [endosymbiont of Tevnia jerichonana (vent Tica)]USF86197.1 LPS export ABC transporter permease LptF [Candidatus Endoriftia persephone]
MISRIDRYLLLEVFKALFAILLVLLLIMLSQSFVAFLKQVAVGEFNQDVVFKLLGLQMVRFQARLIPPAFFFAVLYAVGRMHRDSEMIALQACGVGGWRVFRPILMAAVPMALLVAWLSMVVEPWGTRLKAEIIAAQKGQTSALAGVSPGRFNEYSRGNLVFYVESFSADGRRMHKIFAQHRHNGNLDVISAAEGYQRVDPESGFRYLVLEKGFRYQGEPGQADYTVSEFASYALRIGEAPPAVGVRSRSSLPTLMLLAADEIRFRAEFQKRLAPVLAVLVFTLLSLPLSRSLPRQGPSGRILLAFLIYALYLSLQGASQNWMVDGKIPSWLGMWWVHVCTALLALALMLPEQVWYRRWRRRLRGRKTG